MTEENQEHVALVTGASGGIGEAIARRLAREGCVVILTAREGGRCERIVRGIRDGGGTAHALSLDVTDPESVGNAARAANEYGPVDWLVNNAGIAETAPLLPRRGHDSEAFFRRHLEVNFHGARRMVEAFVPAMVERGAGRVVQIASSAGLEGYPYASAYCASKFALVGYTRSAAAELASTGVRFALVCPHYVDTPLLERSIDRLVRTTGRTREEARAFFAAQNPGGRLVTPEEVADATWELLSADDPSLCVELDGGARPGDPG
ncbi:MAG TPA: SDR family oxidoreductase [Planctomycetes bacterium]|nr:SDR family oxidoreductase [Planctomycetota bacterium]